MVGLVPNKNYIRGRSWEYELMKYLENLSYIVYRTAGSHGAVDLIAFSKHDVRGYQCKTKVVDKVPKDKIFYETLPDIGIMKVEKVTKYIRRKK